MARTPVSTIAQYAPCTIYVRGQVAFSRIASHVEGQELTKQNQEAVSKGRLPHSKPYFSISIKNPAIIDNGKLPVQVKQVIQERFYNKQDGTLMFTQESKSPFLPTVVYSNEAGELAGQGIADSNVPLPAELAVGLDVTVGVSLYSKNGFTGLGINYVLINEPIKYYANSPLVDDLASMGINYVAPTHSDTITESNTVKMPTQQPAQQFTAPQQQTQSIPTPTSAPWETQDIPFNQQPSVASNSTMPQQSAPQVQRPTRFY